MHELFPEMVERPDNGRIAASAIYWPICYILIPFVTTILVLGPYLDPSIITAVDVGYYVLNAIIMISLFFEYIKDSLLTVQINGKGFFKTTGIAAGIMAFLALSIIAVSFRSGNLAALSLFPITETSVLTYPAILIANRPILGLLCSVVLNPFTVSCMFYATVFAPISCSHPKLAYLFMALALMIPRAFNMWWLEVFEVELWTYFVQLPFHMLACWSYQKTDSILAPIISLSIVNLVSSGFILLLYASGMIYIA